jgi:hypothetical protein
LIKSTAQNLGLSSIRRRALVFPLVFDAAPAGKGIRVGDVETGTVVPSALEQSRVGEVLAEQYCGWLLERRRGNQPGTASSNRNSRSSITMCFIPFSRPS